MIHTWKKLLAVASAAILLWPTHSRADGEAPHARDTKTPRAFPKVESALEWKGRAREIREQILVSGGLWPMPEKTPLHPRIFGKTLRDGYSVEKVWLETLPGFYLGGNLYRPVGLGAGPFPAVINPHGHWARGRLNDDTNGSIPARCINFARQGMIAFAYDMVGYNDTRFADSPVKTSVYALHHHFATNDPVDSLWNINLMGLQTWDSIRALDFMESLPDVDKSRLACTGASGGGTQTFILGAIDDRLAAQAPVNMVSHVMQGGCLCENMPGLRVQFSNMEIAAAAAPRPQLLVSATGDWTATTPAVEGPAVGNIYRLFGAEDKLRYVQFKAPHNYNQTSREAVYEWFGQWLRNKSGPVKETPHGEISDADLRLGPPPEDAVTEAQLIANLKESALNRWKSRLPTDEASLDSYKKTFMPAWRRTLQINRNDIMRVDEGTTVPLLNCVARDLTFSMAGRSNETPLMVRSFRPNPISTNAVGVILADVPGGKSFCNQTGEPAGLARRLVDSGDLVFVVRNYSSVTPGDPFADFFTTYNRTQAQQRARDLTLLPDLFRNTLRHIESDLQFHGNVVLCGKGIAGLWALLASPNADAVIADCGGFDTRNETAMLAPDLYCPGLLSLGGFDGIATLHAPRPLLLHNTGKNFFSRALVATYHAVNKTENLRVESEPLDDNAMAAWIASVGSHGNPASR